MRKKLLVFATISAMLFAATACSKGGNDAVPTPEPGQATVSPTAEAGSSTDTTEEAPYSNYDDYVADTVLPASYLGIEVKKVTDEDVNSYIQELLDESVYTEEVDHEVRTGDVVDIDYTGYMDGVAFDGGTGNIGTLEIGSGAFIDGFEDQLIGMKKGETRTIQVTFPDPYTNNPDYAGKAAEFVVTLNSVLQWVTPELTDAFVTELTEEQYTNTTDFLVAAREMLEYEQEYNDITKFLIENTTFNKLNTEMINYSYESTRSYYELYASMYGLDLDTFLLYNGIYDTASFWTDLQTRYEEEEKIRVALYSIAIKENITLTEEERVELLTEIAADSGMTYEEFMEQQTSTEEQTNQALYMEKALNYLRDNKVLVD